MYISVKKVFAFFVSLVYVCNISAQDQSIADSLSQVYQHNNITDSAKLQLLLDLSFNEIRDYNKGLQYAEELISLSQKTRNDKYLRSGYFLKGTKERLLGNLDEALSAFVKSAELAKEQKNITAEADSYSGMADVYSGSNNNTVAKQYYNQAFDLLRKSKDSINLASALLNAGDNFCKNKNYDTALVYCNEAKIIFDKLNYLTGKAYSLGNIGMAYAGIGKNYLAEKNINEAIEILERTQDYYPICDYLISMTDIYENKNDAATAINYAQKSLQLAEQFKLVEQISNANQKLAGLYEKLGDSSKALVYYKNYITYRDSLNNLTSVQKMADLRTTYEVSGKQAEVNLLNEQKTNQKRLLILLAIILALAVVILSLLIRANKHKQHAYEILNKQKQEIDVQKTKAEAAFKQLQSAQLQLVQSEKMASLGELTAGIAHEIQNPLNFVNNFSEVNKELIEELKIKNEKLKIEDEEIKELLNDLIDNEEKINHHGKRADAIVKGMLQHSRKNSGQKEPTDINALCDEFLRLSYHGLRAKDKNFNADFKTDFDESIGKINIVPQDIGRVLLNLFNNAFYAVNEKLTSNHSPVTDNYKPLISVQTKKIIDNVEIIVSDNGNGIPQNIIDKIFQPFFTTKPTGEGTGLGLSLSYDIVKAHGGEIKADTKEGKGSEFIIKIPVV